jgi:hypothetical protein
MANEMERSEARRMVASFSVNSPLANGLPLVRSTQNAGKFIWKKKV